MISIKMKITDFHKISYILVSIDTVIVGVAGFEPAASCSQSRRDNRATLHPATTACTVNSNIFKFQTLNSFRTAAKINNMLTLQ